MKFKISDFIDIFCVILILLSIYLGVYFEVKSVTWLILGVVHATTIYLIILRRMKQSESSLS